MGLDANPSVLIAGIHSSEKYSGGRYHAWMMGEAFAAAGCNVTVWTNEVPLLRRDFLEFPNHERIKVVIDPWFASPPKDVFRLIVLIPHLGNDWRVFMGALQAARRDAASLVLLNFETPNWYNALSVSKRPSQKWRAWRKVARYCDVILSSAEESTLWAKQFYSDVNAEAFKTCYPSINSLAAEKATASKENQVVCITRLDRFSRHKGADLISRAMMPALTHYRFVLIGQIDEKLEASLRRTAEEKKIELVIKKSITDLEKFQEIRKSRFMIFFSSFEGFGYPPVEALYCDIPCLVSDLPILREVCGNGARYISPGDPDTIERAITELDQEIRSGRIFQLREYVLEKVSFDSYVKRLSELVEYAGRVQPNAKRLPDLAYFLFLAEGTLRSILTLLYRSVRTTFHLNGSRKEKNRI
jgi:glycosyltransferase involved in cell wall biosynthesis